MSRPAASLMKGMVSTGKTVVPRDFWRPFKIVDDAQVIAYASLEVILSFALGLGLIPDLRIRNTVLSRLRVAALDCISTFDMALLATSELYMILTGASSGLGY